MDMWSEMRAESCKSFGVPAFVYQSLLGIEREALKTMSTEHVLEVSNQKVDIKVLDSVLLTFLLFQILNSCLLARWVSHVHGRPSTPLHCLYTSDTQHSIQRPVFRSHDTGSVCIRVKHDNYIDYKI